MLPAAPSKALNEIQCRLSNVLPSWPMIIVGKGGAVTAVWRDDGAAKESHHCGNRNVDSPKELLLVETVPEGRTLPIL
jgi:hypothetical protein